MGWYVGNRYGGFFIGKEARQQSVCLYQYGEFGDKSSCVGVTVIVFESQNSLFDRAAILKCDQYSLVVCFLILSTTFDTYTII
ncbi:hypothetical protein KBB05_03515 [Patescibacteria group bacterium]|nr:hypothetical protein [Patescibacteria group bacterium]